MRINLYELRKNEVLSTREVAWILLGEPLENPMYEMTPGHLGIPVEQRHLWPAPQEEGEER